MDIIQEIKSKVPTGTIIPKPEAKADFKVKGWGKRRGFQALIYQIPNHKKPDKPHEKGININEWQASYNRLKIDHEFTKDWFERNLPDCAKEGACNFTTIGGIFQLLGFARYERGTYFSTDQ